MSQLKVQKPKDRPMAPWDDAAGLSFVPRASNSLTSNGQIPHNFPVMESKPSIVLDEWLPAFVRKIIKSAKQDATKAFKGPSKK